jgi:Tfp pilus assembly protein PilZ
MSTLDKRQHARYPASLPVAFALGEVVASESAYLTNISAGGVSFNSMVALDLGTVIMLHFPVSKPVFRTPGRVVWCRKMAFQYGIGVEFVDADANFRQRMVEVVRRIEEYRQEAVRAGRNLSGQDATLEWIELFGSDFFRAG